MDPQRFARAVAKPDRVTVKVHVPFVGSIQGTDADIPFDRIGPASPGLPTDRRTPLAIYCKTGPMSQIAARKLSRLDYHDVIELGGRMKAWTAVGVPLRSQPAPS